MPFHPDKSVAVSVSSNYVAESLSSGQSPLIANSSFIGKTLEERVKIGLRKFLSSTGP